MLSIYVLGWAPGLFRLGAALQSTRASIVRRRGAPQYAPTGRWVRYRGMPQYIERPLDRGMPEYVDKKPRYEYLLGWALQESSPTVRTQYSNRWAVQRR